MVLDVKLPDKIRVILDSEYDGYYILGTNTDSSYVPDCTIYSHYGFAILEVCSPSRIDFINILYQYLGIIPGEIRHIDRGFMPDMNIAVRYGYIERKG